MITSDEPVRGRDLASCTICGALMPMEQRGLHNDFHARVVATNIRLRSSIQGVRGMIETTETTGALRRRRWWSR